MNQKDLMWGLAIKNSNSIETDCLCKVTSVQFTKDELDKFVCEMFEMFRKDLSNHYMDGKEWEMYNTAIGDAFAETYVFTGEVG